MIRIRYKYYGSRPTYTNIIRNSATNASTLPSSFEVVGVEYHDPEIVLLVKPPSDSISQDAVDSIATAFEQAWGTSVDHVDTVVQ